MLKIDELSKLERAIWTNKVDEETFSDINTILRQVNLYDLSMTLKAIPQSGYHGKSVLFYLILMMGWLIAAVSSFMVHKLLEITVALSQSDRNLKENNEELEAMVNQLKANEEQLYFQYKEINQQKEYIEFLANGDYLTNLFNRRKFTEDIMHQIKLEESGTILLLDVDNFKNINDT